jgi:hypothetical protein
MFLAYGEYTNCLTYFGLSWPSSEVSSAVTGNTVHTCNTNFNIRIFYHKIIVKVKNFLVNYIDPV